MNPLTRSRVTLASGLLTAVLAIGFSASAVAQQPAAKKEESGKDIAFNRSKGNCLACHGFPTVEGLEQTGNSGPPMIAMQGRYPDRKVLRAKIWDPTVSNPASMMPPFGKHKLLTEEELDKVLDFLYTL